MIHRTSKKSEHLMRREPQMPMKQDRSRVYLKEHKKNTIRISTGTHGLYERAIE